MLIIPEQQALLVVNYAYDRFQRPEEHGNRDSLLGRRERLPQGVARGSHPKVPPDLLPVGVTHTKQYEVSGSE